MVVQIGLSNVNVNLNLDVNVHFHINKIKEAGVKEDGTYKGVRMYVNGVGANLNSLFLCATLPTSRILLVGPPRSGKSHVTRFLLEWIIRENKKYIEIKKTEEKSEEILDELDKKTIKDIRALCRPRDGQIDKTIGLHFYLLPNKGSYTLLIDSQGSDRTKDNNILDYFSIKVPWSVFKKQSIINYMKDNNPPMSFNHVFVIAGINSRQIDENLSYLSSRYFGTGVRELLSEAVTVLCNYHNDEDNESDHAQYMRSVGLHFKGYVRYNLYNVRKELTEDLLKSEKFLVDKLSDILTVKVEFKFVK